MAGIFSLEEQEKKDAIKYVIDSSSPTRTFFFIMTLSVIIVTFGLLMNNAPIIIGGMLVSPLLSPFIAAALGIVISDFKLIRRSFLVILKASGFAIAISLIISLIVTEKTIDSEVLSRVHPDMNFFYVALASGVAASLSIAKKEIGERIVGVAIAIAVLPPLSVIGIGISLLDWTMTAGAITLFILNLFAIILASVATFSMFRFYPEKKTAKQELKKEDKILEAEKTMSDEDDDE